MSRRASCMSSIGSDGTGQPGGGQNTKDYNKLQRPCRSPGHMLSLKGCLLTSFCGGPFGFGILVLWRRFARYDWRFLARSFGAGRRAWYACQFLARTFGAGCFRRALFRMCVFLREAFGGT